jgi:hypothetical protein
MKTQSAIREFVRILWAPRRAHVFKMHCMDESKCLTPRDFTFFCLFAPSFQSLEPHFLSTNVSGHFIEATVPKGEKYLYAGVEKHLSESGPFKMDVVEQEVVEVIR